MDKEVKIKIPKAFCYEDIEKAKFNILKLSKEWERHLGDEMERAGCMLIMGDSGHGKTAYAMQLMKELCKIEKVHYNTAEEGMRASFRRTLRLNGLVAMQSKFVFQQERYDALMRRLNRRKQPKIAFIDSVQYTFRGKKKEDFHNMIEMFPDTYFIAVSQYKNGYPIGTVAEEFYWDCQNRILVEDWKAHVMKSRCGGDETTPYIISASKAHQRELKLLKKG